MTNKPAAIAQMNDNDNQAAEQEKYICVSTNFDRGVPTNDVIVELAKEEFERKIIENYSMLKNLNHLINQHRNNIERIDKHDFTAKLLYIQKDPTYEREFIDEITMTLADGYSSRTNYLAGSEYSSAINSINKIVDSLKQVQPFSYFERSPVPSRTMFSALEYASEPMYGDGRVASTPIITNLKLTEVIVLPYWIYNFCSAMKTQANSDSALKDFRYSYSEYRWSGLLTQIKRQFSSAILSMYRTGSIDITLMNSLVDMVHFNQGVIMDDVSKEVYRINDFIKDSYLFEKAKVCFGDVPSMLFSKWTDAKSQSF